MFELPADGSYYVHVGDTARHGGPEYAYRLRISAPRPDFALRTVPSSIALRGKSSAAVTVYAVRKDGFAGDIKLRLKDPPEGFSSLPVVLSAKQDSTRLIVRADVRETKRPVNLLVEGRATVADEEEIVREAVPAEDRMQAFLWRHLAPAQELATLVLDPSAEPSPKRVRRTPEPTPSETKPSETKPAVVPTTPAGKSKFTRSQVAGRLRQLKVLFDDWLLTEEFYDAKVAECEAAR
jgi:hypothetical protein